MPETYRDCPHCDGEGHEPWHPHPGCGDSEPPACRPCDGTGIHPEELARLDQELEQRRAWVHGKPGSVSECHHLDHADASGRYDDY